MNEDVLEPGIGLAPLVGRGAKRGDGPLQRGRVVAADVQGIAEGHRLLHAGTVAELLGELEQVRTG